MAWTRKGLMPGCAAAAGAALALAGCGTTTEAQTTTVTVTTAAAADLGPPRRWAEYGHIRSLTRSGTHFVLRFDPAWFLSGETANVAAAEDGVIAKGEPMPNDNYTVDESHRLYTYVVPSSAIVTVLKRSGDGWGPARVPVAELARIVNGASGVKLFEPLASGVWITVRDDRVVSLDQQYTP